MEGHPEVGGKRGRKKNINAEKKYVWERGCDYFSKCFSFRNALKWYFFIFKKLFLISAYQNNLKIQKNINVKQKKLKIFLKRKNKPRICCLNFTARAPSIMSLLNAMTDTTIRIFWPLQTLACTNFFFLLFLYVKILICP